MKNTMLLAAGLLLSVFSSFAQEPALKESLPSQETNIPGNTNNIKYLPFKTAEAFGRNAQTLHYEETKELLKPLSPSYLNVYTCEDHASAGWFLTLQGGLSSFVGDPIGCDDLYGRARPALKVDLGKWINPAFGTRVQYQGFELKSGELINQQYHAVNIDFLWDLLSASRSSGEKSRFELIPFLGCGIIQNKIVDTHPFSLHYGLQGSVQLSSHFDLCLEAGCINTFTDFDGIGSTNHLGDQLLSISLGLTYKLRDKHSSNKVIDAIPYMEQNEELLAYLRQSSNENRQLSDNLAQKERILNEFRKILEIKGRLSKVLQESEPVKNAHTDGYPYNNYSGLNALRRRLSADQMPAKVSTDDSIKKESLAIVLDSLTSKTESDSVSSSSIPDNINLDNDSYLSLIQSDKVCIGAPIMFFFELNSARLTDKSQIANLNEIAQIVNDYNLKITVTGAADSATGNDSINQKLSSIRADYIIEEFSKMGVARINIKKETLGGISHYATKEANRNTSVQIFL